MLRLTPARRNRLILILALAGFVLVMPVDRAWRVGCPICLPWRWPT